jgi:hypothetical protein
VVDRRIGEVSLSTELKEAAKIYGVSDLERTRDRVRTLAAATSEYTRRESK